MAQTLQGCCQLAPLWWSQGPVSPQPHRQRLSAQLLMSQPEGCGGFLSTRRVLRTERSAALPQPHGAWRGWLCVAWRVCLPVTASS